MEAGQANSGERDGRKTGFDDEVLEWLDADHAKKKILHETRKQDYSRKWYRRAIGSTTFLLFWTHLIYVVTHLVVKAHFSYFHVLNWIGCVIFLIGGFAVWTHKTSFQMRPVSVHSVTQFYFSTLFLYLVVGIIAWFINLFRVSPLVQRYCDESPDGECPTGTTQRGLQAFVVIGLLFWLVFFVYMYGTIARFTFLYLTTLERHYFGVKNLRQDLRMWLLVALLGRNLCLLSKTLNFLCCQSCTPRILGKPGGADESSYTADEGGRASTSSSDSSDSSDENQESAASEQAESDSDVPVRRRPGAYGYEESSKKKKKNKKRESSDDDVKAPSYLINHNVNEHGSPNGYLCAYLCCFVISFIVLVACYTSTRSGMLASVGCYIGLVYEVWM